MSDGLRKCPHGVHTAHEMPRKKRWMSGRPPDEGSKRRLRRVFELTEFPLSESICRLVPAEGLQSFSDLGTSRQDRDGSAANTPGIPPQNVCASAWIRTFGTYRSQVQILSPRPQLPAVCNSKPRDHESPLASARTIDSEPIGEPTVRSQHRARIVGRRRSAPQR